MISPLKVGVRVMLHNDKSGNTRVLDSSSVDTQLASSYNDPYGSTRLQPRLPFPGDSALLAHSP
jgi:hypothetical protein